MLRAVTTVMLAAGAAFAQDWVRTSGPSGAYVTAIGASGAEVYAGTFQGQVFRSVDAGQSWLEVTKNLPAGKVQAIGVVGNDTFAAPRDSGLWRTQDHGGSWSSVSPLPLPSSITSIVVANGNLFVLAQNGTSAPIFRSPDQGQTWSPVTAPAPVLVLSSDGATLYAGATLGVYRSTNNGQSWLPGSSGLEFITDHVAPAGPVILTSANHHMFRSVNGGASWLGAAAGLPFNYRVETLATIGAAGFVGIQFYPDFSVYRTMDGGLSWQVSDTGLPGGLDRFPQSMAVAGTTLLMGTPSSIFRTTDSGATWADCSAGMLAGNATALAALGSTLFAAVANRGGLFRTADGRATWTSSSAGLTPNSQIFSVYAGGAVLVGTDRFGISRSDDGGVTFFPAVYGNPSYNGTAGQQYREIAAFAAHGGFVFAGTGTGTEFFNAQFNISGGGVIRSDDGGTNWQSLNTGFPIIAFNNFNEPVYDPVMSLCDGGSALLAGTYQRGVVRTTNLGMSWSPGNGGLPTNGGGQLPEFVAFLMDGAAILGAAAGFANGGTGGTGVFRSLDAGQSWTRWDTGLPAERPVKAIVSDGAALYASVGFPIAPAPADGVYRSIDHGQTWSPFSGPLEGVSCGAMAVVGSTAYVAASARGVWKLGCYANCDGSKVSPVLNVQDFSCFLNRFASGETYANCDASTAAPVLNIQDFSCFLNRFAAGCP